MLPANPTISSGCKRDFRPLFHHGYGHQRLLFLPCIKLAHMEHTCSLLARKYTQRDQHTCQMQSSEKAIQRPLDAAASLQM